MTLSVGSDETPDDEPALCAEHELKRVDEVMTTNLENDWVSDYQRSFLTSYLGKLTPCRAHTSSGLIEEYEKVLVVNADSTFGRKRHFRRHLLFPPYSALCQIEQKSILEKGITLS